MEKNDYLQKLLEKVNVKYVNDPLPADLRTRFPEIKGPLGKDLTFDELDRYPGLQEALAFILHYTPSKWLLEQEAPEIRKRRILHQWKPDTREFQHQDGVPDSSQDDAGDIYRWARDGEVSGICFSGGGIRSATFNLGILQGLASRGSLHQFDYLSSVSGGGYIHSWLAAWLKRRTLEERDKNHRTNANQDDLRAAWKHVTYRLTPLPGRTDSEKYQTVWPRQIQWLRRYSNYLTPQVGLFTSDTWSAVAMWIRNSALNQTLLTTMFLCLLCFPHLLAPSVRLAPNPSVACTTGAGAVGLAAGVVPKALQPCLVNKTKPAPIKISPDRYFGSLFLKYWHGRWDLAGIVSFFYKIAGAGKTIIAALICFATGIALVIFLLRWEYDLALHPVQIAEPKTESVPRPRRYQQWIAKLMLSLEPNSAFMLKLRRHQELIAILMLCLLLIFAILWTLITLQHPEGPPYPVALFLLFLCLVCAETFAGAALAQMMTRRTQTLQRCDGDTKSGEKLARAINRARLIAMAIPAAATGAVAGVAIAALLQSGMMDSAANWLGLTDPWSLRLVLGTILFFWLAPFTMVVASGFVGKDFPDWLSEWLGRIRGYSLMMGIVWVFLCGSSLLMPAFFLHFSEPWERWIKWPAVLTWAATTAGSVLGGKSSKTGGNGNGATGGAVLEAVVLIGPYVYIAGLVFILSLVLEKVHGPLADNLFDHSDLLFWVSAIGIFLFMAGWLGRRLDINEFSMHTFYRNRLTRCYLGASNLTRNPSPVTGFDQRDTADLQIAQLAFDRAYPGPIPIFCCAMNITLGEDLAWQQRKAASFAFTPYYSGYTVGWTEAHKGLRFNGFVPTEFLYEGDPSGTKDVGGPNLATAMAASGAAVSPNWGYHTNPATAFLMTMFDVRLGLWIPNPRHSPLAGQKLGVKPDSPPQPSSPAFAPARLASELLGSVDDTSKYVYLTDGGHFDNMGLYELVRRRCYKIVICDAEEDGDYSYEGIGDAIRKCRIDFGAEIELDLSPTRPNANSRLSTAHMIQGTIRYPETPSDQKGAVWYIKASLTGKPPAAGEEVSAELPDVPGDVQNYKLQHPHFPHDSTAEQWFTESQFESYRRLGQSIVDGL
jgi:Patatin-like phospholipase